MARSRSGAPDRRFGDAIADERHEERRRPADEEHPAPAVARANEVIGDGREKHAEVKAGV
jgi:hypothetical protein